jgi:hypothetical protein
VLRIYPQLDQKTAIQFLDYVLERLPFRVEVIQTDNGAEFQSRFHWHVLDKGIGHVYIKPHTPRLNGKVERSHRIDAEEFYQLLDGVVIDDTEVFNDKLREWENFYNYHGPTAASAARRPMRDSSSEPRPACNQPSSVAHCAGDPTVPLTSPYGAPRLPLAAGREARQRRAFLAVWAVSRATSCGWWTSRMLGNVLHRHRRGELW